jgi:predicted pyridoxine 5'-phosphate oxidase superfamily flavin-nucleotide-binding protein
LSDLYDDTHRVYQILHDCRVLADRLESLAHAEFVPKERAFIEAAAMFFIATVDHKGRPTVSYKGGDPGFVRVVSANELVFPVYDGNGMFLTVGNISGREHVGLLFIDFQSPHRLRVQGTARVFPARDVAFVYPGAQYVVRVLAQRIFVNCGRYVHKLGERTLSRHVPDASGHQPFPAWKRIDLITDALSEKDRATVMHTGGTIPAAVYPGEDATCHAGTPLAQ